MCSGHGIDGETGNDVLRQAGFLVDLDRVAAAHDTDVWAQIGDGSAALFEHVLRQGDDGMGALDVD
ncbi:hypothetical protein D3C87_2115500 [compost metagenome]